MSHDKLRERCQYFRSRADCKQKDLASQLFVAPSTLSKWENGAAPWPAGSLTRYTELLHLNEAERQELAALVQDVQVTLCRPERKAEAQREATVAAPFPKQEPIPLRRRVSAHLLIAGSGTLLILIIISAMVWLRPQQPQPPGWQEAFDPPRHNWSQISATWQDFIGPEARLRENNPTADFGKVESDVIRLDVDVYPILRIEVGAIDSDASYTIQILDKRTGVPKDALKGITVPGPKTVNLVQELGWHGEQEFTINIWISGENKSVTFHRLSIEALQE